MSIKILVDSGSDITKEEAEKIGIEMIPLIVSFGAVDFYDGVNLLHNEFYQKLQESKDLPKTSQVTPARFSEVFTKLTENGDKVIVITISSKLSGTYSSAVIAAEDFNNQVYVVDSGTAAVGQRMLMNKALEFIEKGLEIEEIVEKLNTIKQKITIMAIVDTLEYLKKGGRISSTVAFAGELFNIKPILYVRDGEIEMIGKAIGARKANKLLNKFIMNSNGINDKMPYGILWSGNDPKNVNNYCKDFKDELKIENKEVEIYRLGCAIGTHVGPGVVGFAFFEK